MKRSDFLQCTAARDIVKVVMLAVALMASSLVWGQGGHKDQVSFDLVVVPAFTDCLRAAPGVQPTAHATVVRGKQNDNLLLDLNGVRPNLTLSVFSTERTILNPDGAGIKPFPGFGLSWYQSDISTGKNTDKGHVELQTILLDETFGFDKDLSPLPINVLHLGLWFDDPQDAVACGFDPNNAGVFNGEHKSGPLAFTTVSGENGLGPLCREVNLATQPPSCGPSGPLPAARVQ